jgi:soluble P-type ATPase
MLAIDIPGRGQLQLDHLVLDVNGTLAVDGVLIDGVVAGLGRVKGTLDIHLLTADTHGRQAELDRQLGLTAVHIPPGGEAEAKAAFVRVLGADAVVAMGQGANDAGMLREAAIGVAVMSTEGTSIEALTAADLVVPDILLGLALIEHPMRLKASLRR